MNNFNKFFHRPFFIKLFHWEYWSMDAVYALIYPIYVWLCVRAGFRFFFTAADPNIRYGGFLMESKKEIYDQLPEGYYPKTLLFTANTSATTVLNEMKKNGLAFPLIAKPDIGLKGYAVKKISTSDELHIIIPKFTIDFLIQEFVPFEKELGIFYCRYPEEKKGFISGIVAKEFMTVTGDGIQTIEQLVRKNKRYLLQLDVLKKEFGNKLEDVLPEGEQKELLPYGNHVRGSLFLDYSDRTDEQLNSTIDTLMQQVPEFYFGRIDLRYKNWEDMKEGKNISIIELNGAGSEPTHIYDPKHSIFFAWKEIIRHWFILWRISKQNLKRGFPYMSLKDGRKMFRDNSAYIKKIEAVHQQLLEKSS